MRNRPQSAPEANERDTRVAIRRWPLLACLVALLAACSHDECRGPLSEVGAECPDSYDGTEPQLPVCLRGLRTTQSSRTCGDLIQLWVGGGFGGTYCFYDSSSHALVGARVGSDTSELCGNSFTKIAGRVTDASCDNLPWTVMRQCP